MVRLVAQLVCTALPVGPRADEIFSITAASLSLNELVLTRCQLDLSALYILAEAVSEGRCQGLRVLVLDRALGGLSTPDDVKGAAEPLARIFGQSILRSLSMVNALDRATPTKLPLGPAMESLATNRCGLSLGDPPSSTLTCQRPQRSNGWTCAATRSATPPSAQCAPR